MLISGPAVAAAQILIWSYSCVFLPPGSTVIRTSEFCFVGVLSDFFYIPKRHSLPSWLCGFHLQLVQLAGWFWVFFLSHTAPDPIVVLFIFLHVGCPLGFASEVALQDLGLPLWGQVRRWDSCLGRRGSGSTRYSAALVARAAGNIVLWKGMATSIGHYAPVVLPGEPPPPWQISLAGHSLQDRRGLDKTKVTLWS